ncbi:unnamed protein product [marine sediment metagenome]|uniref:Uncharacterized protein n=1 Tax=marine sediment metagenome TaxID=412755 RepID=X1MQY3_9ZZZZ
MAKQTPSKEETKKDIEEFIAGRKSKPEQSDLFGDQDFVYNVLQTELSDISDEIEKTQEAIGKKKEKLEKLRNRKQEVDKAAGIVANQKKEVKDA